MNFYNRFARGGSFGRREYSEAKRTSPISPVGLSSAAVVKTELREEKTLAGFGPTGHSGIHIQSALSIPFARPSLTPR